MSDSESEEEEEEDDDAKNIPVTSPIVSITILNLLYTMYYYYLIF